MNRYLICVLLGLALLLTTAFLSPQWGFFGHRKINRMAVFTLPIEIIGFYKKNIEYLTEHSVDPDKRRYATKFEAVRHYIDIDHWGVAPFDNVPRAWHDAILSKAVFYKIENINDTTSYVIRCNPLADADNPAIKEDSLHLVKDLNMNCDSLWRFFYNSVEQRFYEDQILIPIVEMNAYLPEEDQFVDTSGYLLMEEHFSEYGILPYHLASYYTKLVGAFQSRETKAILRLSAEIGHYIGDAHVPLHTSENYNGQMTNQIGIHGFWESRLPELFADEEYDYFVGKAEYVDDVKPYFWDVVLTSNSYLAEVFAVEKELSQTYPQDQQYCYEERLERTIQTQCTDYAAAYHGQLDGMVETRMRDAILSIGTIWYSAWIDAGQPDLDNLDAPLWNEKEQEELEAAASKGKIIGRQHDN